MSTIAKMDIRVRSSRGHSIVSITSHGRYVSFTTAGYQRQLGNQPLITTASVEAFWAQILGIVTNDLASNPATP